MTCFGAGSAARGGLRLEVEIKSVNHRFLDTQMRLPREYQSAEAAVLAQIKAHFSRGRVELFLRQDREEAAGRLRFDVELAKAYRDGLQSLKSGLGLHGDVDLALIIGQPGVISQEDPGSEGEADVPLLEEALAAALAAAVEMREREGEALREDLAARFAHIGALREAIAEAVLGEVEGHRARLLARVQEVLGRAEAKDLDEGRLLQEVTYLCDRSDITEELTRLSSHLEQARGLLIQGGAVGRQIEFLVQEVLRETNTIASKATTGAVKHHAVHIKVEVEKIREQVQNVE